MVESAVIESVPTGSAGCLPHRGKTNLPFHAELPDSAEFGSGSHDTSVVARLRPRRG
ncbi:MAG TPA: hypothetical protein VMV92_24885 [Streptosporangiaceae bacterium]|nr:hypothetical protein [Streptosporangiaceae bacterium]